jgi:hypothetical protein
MYFYYAGTTPIDILVPGEQYAVTITPTERSQKTSNAKLYDYLFSDVFPNRHLFTKTDSFDPPAKKPKAEKPKEDAVVSEVSAVENNVMGDQVNTNVSPSVVAKGG